MARKFLYSKSEVRKLLVGYRNSTVIFSDSNRAITMITEIEPDPVSEAAVTKTFFHVAFRAEERESEVVKTLDEAIDLVYGA